MRSLTTQLKEFHILFDVDSESPHHLQCVAEEMDELGHELGHAGPENAHLLAKEAIDVVYTIVSLFVANGWDFEAAFEEVHRSNMSKLGDCGEPVRREDGKILKGPYYEPADMHSALHL